MQSQNGGVIPQGLGDDAPDDAIFSRAVNEQHDESRGFVPFTWPDGTEIPRFQQMDRQRFLNPVWRRWNFTRAATYILKQLPEGVARINYLSRRKLIVYRS